MQIIEKIKKRGIGFALRRFDRLYGIGALEKTISKNWWNPFLTLWICFRSFPFRQAVCLPLFVYGRPRIYGLSGRMRIEGKVSMGMIHFNASNPGAPCVGTLQSDILNDGQIVFHGKCQIRTGCRIRVGESGVLEMGNSSIVADMCTIGCFMRVMIGNTTRIAHRSQVLDSNYHYMANFERKTISPRTIPIEIGNNCWVCNSTTVTGGAKIPDFTIVASNSLVGKDFSSLERGSLIGGTPAKFLAKGIYRIENKKLVDKVLRFYQDNGEGEVFHLDEETGLSDIL